MDFRSILIGGIEDQVEAFVQKPYDGYVGAPFGSERSPVWQSNQPLFSIIYNGGSSIFDPVIFSTLFAVFSIVLSLIFSFILFRSLKMGKLLSVVLSLLFSLSPYTFLHIGIHPALSQIWVIPLYMMHFFKIFPFTFKGVSRIGSVACGLVLALATLLSNYLGFLLILFSVCLFISNALILRFRFRLVLAHFKKLLLMFVVFITTTVVILFPYIKVNYFGVARSGVVQDHSYVDARRTLEDFQNFSARPWYYVLPPLAHPVLGTFITDPVLDWMKNDWGYFLADDYFSKEHGGDYLGWFNLAIFFIAIYFSLKQACQIIKFQSPIFDRFLKVKGQRSKVKSENQKSKDFYSEENLKLVVTLMMTIVLLFLFTMPPFFTISGHKIYTLGFVLYKFFPMFRVTARLGVVLLMCILIVNGVFLQSIIYKGQKSKVKSQKLKSKFKIILIIYAIFTLFEFYVPVSTFDTSKVPAVYEYLAKIDETVSFDFAGPNGKIGSYEGPLIIAEYPGGRAEDIYWITKHKKGLINPRRYYNLELGFEEPAFSKALLSEEGLNTARDYHVSYIVFHKDRFSEPSYESEEFFRNHLEVEKEFGDIILFKL